MALGGRFLTSAQDERKSTATKGKDPHSHLQLV
jgi:hypothetical protein